MYMHVLSAEDGNEEIWCESEPDTDTEEYCQENDVPAFPEFPCDTSERQSASALSMWLIGFLLTLQARFYLPDRAVDALIKFFFAFLTVVSRYSPSIEAIARAFPSSLHLLRKRIQLKDHFNKLVVCTKCFATYDYEICFYVEGTQRFSKRCTCVKFPNHPHQRRRQLCGNLLLKTAEFLSGKKLLYPFKLYCYKGLQASLQTLLLRSEFYLNCQLWRDRSSSPDSLDDVYGGRIWNEFQSFLLYPLSFAFILNIDWFQPFTHTQASVGVIYLTVLNLPRFLRYKRENVILVGIIPGPNEPQDMNPFLQPLVKELLKFWEGIKMSVSIPIGVTEQIVKGAVLCVACDLPAGRKICGFLGHSAKLGCSKCLKVFPGSVGDMDYSGFDRSQWQMRGDKQHRENVDKTKKCPTKTGQAKAESMYGCRYSVLLELPYFDAPRMLSIDPMHNLFLGTCKRMMSVWLERNFITKHHYQRIQKVIDDMSVPSDIGRIPQKVESGFAGFKADQYKTWATVYSIPALYGIIPADHFECWRHFVLACRILCKQKLSYTDINLADALLIRFCKRAQTIYGKTVVSPNMHLHGHLKDVILDYGPPQEFWLFSFERYNGMLGNQPTNNRSIESQLMKRFLSDTCAYSYQYPEEFNKELRSLIVLNAVSGSVRDTLTPDLFALPPKYKRSVFDSDAVGTLQVLLSKLHPSVDLSELTVTVNSVFEKYSSITLHGKSFTSTGNSKQPHSLVQARWVEDLYGKPPTSLPDPHDPACNLRPVKVHYYLKAFYFVNNSPSEKLFAFVSWLFPHPQRHAYGKPAELWCNDLYESFGLHSFVPLEHLLCRCAHAIIIHNEEHLSLTVSLVE